MQFNIVLITNGLSFVSANNIDNKCTNGPYLRYYCQTSLQSSPLHNRLCNSFCHSHASFTLDESKGYYKCLQTVESDGRLLQLQDSWTSPFMYLRASQPFLSVFFFHHYPALPPPPTVTKMRLFPFKKNSHMTLEQLRISRKPDSLSA